MYNSMKTCPDFVEILASKEPIPGGGGASALCAAIGTALGNMVGSLTVGKKKYADVEDRIIELKAQSDALQDRFLKLIDEDGEAFVPLAKAYSLPTETDEQKAHKALVLEECSKKACMVPFEIMEKTCEAIDIIEEFANKGSRLAVSDAGCAASICRGALQAASLNIFINTKSLQDREFAEDINNKANEMLRVYCAKAEAIFESVKNGLNPSH